MSIFLEPPDIAELTGYRIEYTTYNKFDNARWADQKSEAERIATGLSKLKHVSNVRIVNRDEQQAETDRFMFCGQCNFMCRLKQLPRGFCLDTNEPDNPFVWCKQYATPEMCSYRKRLNKI